MVNLKKKYFSEKECTEIESKIAEIEKKTSGEIVLALVPTSDSYFRIRLMGGTVGWFLASFISLLLESKNHWGIPFWEFFSFQTIGFLTGIALSYIPLIARFLVPKHIRNRNIQREAFAQFTALGLHKTKDHTGVLIFLSIFERSVQIVADHGIHQLVEDGYWKKQTNSIAEGFGRKDPAGNILKVLSEIGEKLSKHFPPDPNNTDELPNKVRFLG